MITPRIAAYLIALIALVACDRKPKTPLERGAGIFTRSCSGCHGFDGRGRQRPGFKVPPRNLTDPAVQARLTDDDIKRTIRVGKGQMPAFGGLLDERDLSDLVLFVRSLDRRAGKDRPPAPSRPSSRRIGHESNQQDQQIRHGDEK